jgi:hypothetical protein
VEQITFGRYIRFGAATGWCCVSILRAIQMGSLLRQVWMEKDGQQMRLPISIDRIAAKLTMCRLVFPFFCAVLLTACSPQRPVSLAALPPSEALQDYQRKVEAMRQLQREADLVLEAQAVDRFRLVKPDAGTEQTAIGLDGCLRLMTRASRQGSGLVVLIIPQTEIVQGTHKIMDEVILDVRDAAARLGYQRFVVGAHGWGNAAQIYTDGLPSREQVAEKKRSWKELAANVEKENAK